MSTDPLRSRSARAALLAALLALAFGMSAATAPGPATVAHPGGQRIDREGQPAPSSAPTSEPLPAQILHAPRVEVAFVLDTTGSMSGLIEGAKREIWSIANRLAGGQPTPEVRMALVGYRDRGDEYVTRLRDLTDDIDAVHADLQAFSAGGGGDAPESVNQALHEAVTRLAWSEGPGVYRVIFLVGDAPPHLDYADDVGYAESVRLARRRGIVVNTVQCGDYAETTPIWREIAAAGGGRFAAIRQDGGMLALEAPMDGDLARLNRELAGTWVPWGGARERAELEAKRERAVAAEPAAAASRLAFLAKLGGRVNAGRADLVDALAAEDTSLDELAEEELPPELRALAPGERAAWLEAKAAARRRLQAQIGALAQERDAWLAAESTRRAASGAGDGFDARVLESVREQAAEAGITY